MAIDWTKPEMLPAWTAKLPLMGDRLKSRAVDIERRRVQIMLELDNINRAEARLFMDINNSGEWTPQEMSAALVELPFDVVLCLPDDMQNKKKTRKRKGIP
jgi:hypothetical protein